MSNWIAETVTDGVGWSHLERLADIDNRMAGSEGERAGAEATRDAFDGVGARNARLDAFDLQGWTRGSSSLAHPDSGDTADCIALPRSPNALATGELVDLGYGLPSDFEGVDLDGRVVMTATNVPDYYDRSIHRGEKYRRAVDAGAAAFVFRNHVEGCLPPTGSVGTVEEPIGEIPAVGVSKEAGLRLARRFEGEAVTVAVEADIHDATSRNVHAELGPDTDEAVLLTSHVDAHDISEGAGDNGSGTAMLVALANALAAREDDLDTRVEFVAFGAEEVGLDGSKHHASTVDPDSVKAVVNLDGVVRGRTLLFFTHEFDELEGAVRRAAATFDHPVKVIPEAGPPGDQWPLVQRGVPGYFVASVRETEGLGRGRGWGHTAADTLDKLDARNLPEQALVLTELAVDLASDDVVVEHREPPEVAETFERAGRDEELKARDDWPFDP